MAVTDSAGTLSATDANLSAREALTMSSGLRCPARSASLHQDSHRSSSAKTPSLSAENLPRQPLGVVEAVGERRGEHGFDDVQGFGDAF